MIPSAIATHHRTPTGLLLGVLIALALLYFAWRLGQLGKLRGAVRMARVRSDARDLRIGPLSLLPLAVLVIVVVLVLITH